MKKNCESQKKWGNLHLGRIIIKYISKQLWQTDIY